MLKPLLFLTLSLVLAGKASAQTDASAVALVKADSLYSAKPDFAETATSGEALAKADSLYNAKQYTQALDLYHSFYQSGQYTPAMLLKMAHIQEGLGRLGESLFYLNIYFLATDDQQALKKMEELAKKNNLEGYETSETTRILSWLQEHYTPLAMSTVAVALLLLSLAYYLRKRQNPSAAFAGVLYFMVLTVLFVHINFTRAGLRGIVSDPQTYLMNGPSGGASVVAIIGEGHQLEIEGKKDVWYRVRWKERDVWVKESRLRTIEL